jgi:hypothetical protein
MRLNEGLGGKVTEVTEDQSVCVGGAGEGGQYLEDHKLMPLEQEYQEMITEEKDQEEVMKDHERLSKPIPDEIMEEIEEDSISKNQVIKLLSEMDMVDENGEMYWE